ncbi:hypothetical protein ACFWBR_27115 [Streptomyces sp. NPDC060006]|uniref:hypothetical protein n=1 Tax=unclassified Streptomyces TaxID=2593676 RepID=UPI0036BA1A36
MSDTATVIFTVTVGGLFALAGAYIGYRAGRRQTSDQAIVEHGQWLRGQRQHAYLAFVGTWDTWVESLQGVQQSWESRVHEYQQDHAVEDPAEAASRLLGEAWRAVRGDLERVELLGPQRIDFAVRAMEEAFVGMRDVITAQGQVGATCPHWDEWNPALILANTARFNFHAAAIRTLRQPPSPAGERERLEE